MSGTTDHEVDVYEPRKWDRVKYVLDRGDVRYLNHLERCRIKAQKEADGWCDLANLAGITQPPMNVVHWRDHANKMRKDIGKYLAKRVRA